MRRPPADTAPRAQPDPVPAWRFRDWVFAALILASVAVVYRPVWHAGFIWDDNGHVTRADLRPLHGLWRIWFEAGATQQYYPLLHTAFWIEHRIWGDSAALYHAANIALHGLVALLLYAVLRRLAVPGALLGAWAFALHPVCVESVAWVAEQKNTLSAALYLMAALAYLGFDRRRNAAGYALATALFCMALATKTVTATLPAALLVVFWWKRGTLSWRRDILPLMPWFVLAAGSGAVTAWVESRFIGASGAAYNLGFADRLLVAGHALWFYLAKALWPTGLMFMYPHWDIASGGAVQWAYPLAAAAAIAVLFALRSKSRGPLATALLFAGTLFPALGFINVYPFIYSYVADHFQYLALAILVSAIAAGLTLGARRLPSLGRKASVVAAGGVLGLMGGMSTSQCALYVDSESLWVATVARNPTSWMAYQNLGGVYLAQGFPDRAEGSFNAALAINPGDHEALNELGVAQMAEGRLDAAEATLRRALDAAPNSSETHLNLGAVLLRNGKADEAAMHVKGVLEVDPTNAKAMKVLAGALFQQGDLKGAEDEYRLGLEAEPHDAQGHSDYGAVLATDGQMDDAITEYAKALAIQPDLLVALTNLGGALLRERRADEAADCFRRAVALQPREARLANDLGIALAEGGHTTGAVEQFRKALELQPNFEQAQRNLDAVLRGAPRP